MRLRKASVGFTLTELLIVLTLIGITLSFALPGWSSLVENSRKKTIINDLVNLFNVSRNVAIQRQIPVTICPIDPGTQKCSRDWSLPITAFADPDRDRVLTDTAQIIKVSSPPSAGQLVGGTGIRRYFGFRPNGMAVEAIGNVTWCAEDKDPSKALQLRINMGGRLVHAQDQDGDGIVEASNGKAISCS
ncbi:MAG: GspH/FimT family pseudopilin [Marinobacter sp.]|uniref:GspH/FimT family pseudopilin n=1 Tax=Marinobacter sp. TaxID=50741 RepID=UPI0034A0797E